MDGRNHNGSGVSEVVGEMLMIGLVIVLIGVFAATLGNFFPTSREPSVIILLTADTANDTITLWHKGGDWVKKEDLMVVVSYPNDTVKKIPYSDSAGFVMVPDKIVFDLGSNITIKAGTLTGDETVSLVTSRSRIFTGRVVR
ncbi:MAG TPA: type IV pilin N-terminal domain-containing protein [Methanoregula sp.]|nr:type IV pilin N-terminal domain-containing protein [Methanoregula sp.]